MKYLIMTASVLVLAITSLPGPVLAETSYAWSLTCNGGGSGSWSWLKDGVAIANQTFTPACSTGGTGAVSSTANGIYAYVSASVGFCTKNDFCACPLKGNAASVTKSFDPSKGVSINLHVSVQEQCNSFGFTGKLSSSVEFSLRS